MLVRVFDIHDINPGHVTTLPGVVRLAFSKGVRPKLAALWSNEDGITVNVDTPFVISSEGSSRNFAYKYPLIKEPNELAC